MNPARRATPDSEAVGSSEDERPWPSSTSFGQFAMTESGVPGLPGGIWSTGKRGSFKLDGPPRGIARDAARLGAGMNVSHPALRATPSPSASEGASLPFAIPLQPTPKTGRSLSHSQGQREAPQTSGAPHASAVGGASSSGGGPALPLGLLAEEVDTESESDGGNRLTHTTSHPPIGSLMRTATLPATYEHSGASNGNGRDHIGDGALSPQSNLLRGRTFEAAFQNLSLDQSHRRAQWQSHLGWDDVPNVNESRRHSLADIPTRRGSLAAGEPSQLSRAFTHQDIDEESGRYANYTSDRSIDAGSDRLRAQDSGGVNVIPPMYRVPYVTLTDHEQNEIDARRGQQGMGPPVQWGPGGPGRPRKQLYVVSFKCSRVDVFYLLDNTGLLIREGDMVIVEADRGQDLGTVQHAKVTPDAARLLKKKYLEEQYKWLMMYSRNKDGGLNPNAQFHGDNNVSNNLFPDAPSTMQGSIPRSDYNNLKPKAIKRLANDHEIKMLAEKEGNEAKAKRTCQQKVAHLRLQMEILDAEWQWDFQKLIFYYYADHYINFKDLITELYRIYKTRIWLSAINPASFSQHAMGQPPAGIGPGAVGPYNPYAMNNNYTMAYGEDRDPYGAQMPYRIPYDTYNPNYPAIPGVANSFAPSFGSNYFFYGQGGGPQAQPGNADGTSTTEQNPAAHATGGVGEYNFYDRSGADEHNTLLNRQAGEPTIPPGGNGITPFNRFTSAFGAMSMGETTNTWRPPSMGSNPNSTGTGQQAPIGTARPPSQGKRDHGVPTEEQRQNAFRASQFRSLDPSQRAFTRQSAVNESAVPNPNGPRTGTDFSLERLRSRDADQANQAASRVQNVDRYLAGLSTPAELHADDMSRER